MPSILPPHLARLAITTVLTLPTVGLLQTVLGMRAIETARGLREHMLPHDEQVRREHWDPRWRLHVQRVATVLYLVAIAFCIYAHTANSLVIGIPFAPLAIWHLARASVRREGARTRWRRLRSLRYLESPSQFRGR